MEILIDRGCGLDVHNAVIVACLLVRQGKKFKSTLRRFGTTTRELLALRDWLRGEGCTHVAMESTGVYWKPVYALLEGHLEVIVANAQLIKKVPGRKTDVKDAEWIADLLCHGLLRPSFVPPQPIRELRDLTRYRRKLVGCRNGERGRLHKLLVDANIRLSCVASDIFGVSGWKMLEALVEGRATPAQMAELAVGKLRSKAPELERALEGRMEEHHRRLLRLQMRRLQQVDADIAEVEAWIAEKLKPYAPQLELLRQIPGVDETLAAVIIAELGVDMSVFGSVGQVVAWAGVCPGNHESAGKKQSGRTTPGNVHLKTALVEAAHCASRAKGTYLREKFYRLKSRRGHKRAALGVGHKILVAVYYMLSRQVPYQELGDAYLDKRSKNHIKQSLVRRLERMGYEVTLKLKAA